MGAEAVRLSVVSADGAVDFSLIAARAAFGKLEGWAMSEEACALPEHEVEAGLQTRGREAIRLMLQAHMNRRGTGRVGAALSVVRPEGETVRSDARTDERKIVSIFGDVTARRTAYAAPGRESVHPLDEKASLPARSFSYEVQRRVVDESVRGPFDEAVESIEKTTGNVLSKRSAEEIAADAAEDFDAFYQERKAPPAEGTGPVLVAAVDCKGVPLVKPDGAAHAARRKKGEKANRKKMATVAAVFTQRPRIRTPEGVAAGLFDDEPQEHTPRSRPEQKRVRASIEKTKDEVIAEAVAEMDARDPEGAKLRVAVTDGERALMILRGGVSQVVKGMRGSATKRGLTGAKRKAVDSAAGYFMRNRDRMRYDTYLATGLPIASGAVEGACKNLVKDRMERSGMRWQVPGAEAVSKLRAVKLSGDMDEYWPFHIAREQARLFGGRTWSAVANAK